MSPFLKLVLACVVFSTFHRKHKPTARGKKKHPLFYPFLSTSTSIFGPFLTFKKVKITCDFYFFESQKRAEN